MVAVQVDLADQDLILVVQALLAQEQEVVEVVEDLVTTRHLLMVRQVVLVEVLQIRALSQEVLH
jgi:hypothetical protein